MKTFNKTYLPDSVTYNGLNYTLEQSCANEHSCKLDAMDLMCKGKKVVRVNVLSKNLKGKTDLFGQPYRPTIWLFSHNTQMSM